MNPLELRAELLISQQRYAQAVEVLRDALVRDPNNARVHSLLAISLAQTNQYDAATEHARQAIEQAPDSAQSHFSLAWVMVERRRWKEARQAVDSAISLAPEEARFYWMLSRIDYCQCQWRQALQAADLGLAIQPDDQGCMNMRALCHLALGDKQLAAEATQQSLERRPEDPWAHASQGWAQLTNRQSQAAMESFREALRLDPSLEWARRGMVEALKSRHWIYRAVMRLRSPPPPVSDKSRSTMNSIAYQIGRLAIIAGWVLSLTCCVIMPIPALYSEPPPPTWYWMTFAIGLFCFVGVVLAGPIGNLFLLVDRWGRHVLSDDEVRGARLLAASLLLPATGSAAAMASGDMTALAGGLMLSVLAVPLSFLYRCHPGWPRQIASLIIAGLIALGIFAAVPSWETASPPKSRALSVMALLYATFFGTIILARLSRAQPKR
ncbi:MAG TPA: tetratricopeptide repeat protein [Pirellulaceae bacterium]|nr:tetratricopeptide repeat protein [Pirellulaceae bacterium]